MQTHFRNEINSTQRYYYTAASTNKDHKSFTLHLAAHQHGTQL